MNSNIRFFIKYIGLSLFIAPLFALFFTLNIKNVCAQNPIPDPVVACNEIRDNEFHSLRPYQASVCNTDYEVALACGNSVYLTDTFSVEENGNATPSEPGTSLLARTCTQDPDTGVNVCTFTLRRTKTFSIDLSGAKLPIMGNTENVRNIVNNETPPEETIDDAQKVNEYVSWYLQGVPRGREYGPVTATEPEEFNNLNSFPKNIRTVIDYSGPLNKLLPLRIQQRERLEQVDNAVASLSNTATGENQRHNQIVGCSRILVIPFLGATYAFSFHVACNGSFLGEIFTDVKRLSDWDPEANRPPLEEEYMDRPYVEYLVALREWRGSVCITRNILGFDFVFCADPNNPASASRSFIGQIFSYIPYSSTEDTEGKVRVEQNPEPLGQTGDVIVDNLIVTQNESTLYFPHMTESNQLANTLQQTFVPRDLDLNAPADAQTTVGDEFCNVVQIKTNPGDSLFPDPEVLTPQFDYDATFTCAFALDAAGSCQFAGPDGLPIDGECVPNGFSCNAEGPSTCGSGYKCGTGCNAPSVPSCNIVTNHSIPVYTETPYADSIWAKLVAGPSAVFKRIFPKVGFDGPISEIVDAPAAINTSYTTDNPGTNVSAADARAGVNAELYIPHIGGIHEYFLECIQTALKPDGLGRICGDFATPLNNLDPTGTLIGGFAIPNTPNVKFPQVREYNTNISLAANPGTTADQNDTTRRANYWSKSERATNFGTPFFLGSAQGNIGATAVGLFTGKDGTIYTAWQEGPTESIYFRRKTASGSWEPAKTVINAPDLYFARIAVSSSGTIFVTWHVLGDNLQFSQSNDGGNTWSSPRTITGGVYGFSSSLDAGQNGEVVVTYGKQNRIYAAVWNGSTFVEELVHSSGVTPTVSIGNDGKIYIVGNMDSAGIKLAERRSPGNWTISQVSIGGTNFAGKTAFDVDSNGGLHVAWADNDAGKLMYRYRSPEGTWTTIQAINGNGRPMFNADGVSSSGGALFHVVVEGGTGIPSSNIRYFLISGRGSGSTTPPTGSCTVTDPNVIRNNIRSWGLPAPQESVAQSLRTSISSGAANWSARSILEGERIAIARGFNVIQYLTAGWLWFENGTYPDLYSVNCNDSPSLSTVSQFCNTTNFQVAGYQVSKNYQTVFNRVYPGTTDDAFRAILRRVITNSSNAIRPGWRYQGTTGLLSLLSNVQSTATFSELATSGTQLVTGGTTTAGQRRQLITLIAGKDPAMVAALNSGNGGGGVSYNDLVLGLVNAQCTYGYICAPEKQRLSNQIYALWMLDCQP